MVYTTEYKTMEIDKKLIEEKMIKKDWQRPLYPSRVNFFINCIKNNKFRNSLISIAVEGDKWVLLDGQHKLEAIKITGITKKMDVKVNIGMTEKEMIEEYNILNDVKLHRPIDFIRQYIGKNDVLDAFLDSNLFPINISLTAGKNAIRVDRFLNIIYNSRITDSVMKESIRTSFLKSFITGLTTQDFTLMKEFFTLYRKCFDEPTKDNWVYRVTIVITLLRFWIANKNYFSEADIIKAFKPIQENTTLKLESKGVDRMAMSSLAYKMLPLLNKGRSVNLFKKFWKEDSKGNIK